MYICKNVLFSIQIITCTNIGNELLKYMHVELDLAEFFEDILPDNVLVYCLSLAQS